MKRLGVIVFILNTVITALAQNQQKGDYFLKVDYNLGINGGKAGFVVIPSGYHVISFDLSYKHKTGDLLGPLHSNSGQFSKEQIDMLSHSRPGDLLFFENIKVKDDQTGYEYPANSFVKKLE
jgi:hypothetical protein